MKVDNALILAAGKGTRMGNVGKILPKVIWPIFEKTILELEVAYAKSLGAKKVFINLYNYKDIILSTTKNNAIFDDVTFLEEEEKLDIGGAVHNLARAVDYQGSLLILNSDQFIMLKDDVLKSMESIYKDSDGVLLTYQVNSNDHYNATIASEGKLQRIQQNSEIERDTLIDTYTGISLINLSRLKRSDGKSSFFETVANFKKMNIQTINISNSVYWDFGTLDRYYKSMFQIINLIESSDAFVQFLIKNAGIDLDKVSSTSYNTKVDNSINLVKDSYAGPPNKIIIENVGQLNLSDQACIVLGNQIDKITLVKK